MATTELIELVIETSKNAYVPYSHFPVGAVLVAKDGSIIQVSISRMLVIL